MKIEDNTSAPSGAAASLRPQVGSTGSEASVSAGVIATEDQHIADAIKAMDPIHDVPSPHQIPNGWKVPPLRVSALPKEAQAKVNARLAALPPAQREAMEAAAVEDAIREMLPAIRLRTGVGSTALPYHREMALIGREWCDLADEYDRIADELCDIERHETRFNSATGEHEAVPVYRIDGPRRDAYGLRQADLLRQMRLLQADDGSVGIEAAKRMREAMGESVGLIKERNRQVAVEEAARKRADEVLFEEEVAKKAASYASRKRATF